MGITVNSCRATVLAAAVLIVTHGVADGRTPPAPSQREDQLLKVLRVPFQKKNPKLSQVGVLDLKAWDFVGPRLILGWAIVRDHQFRGDFNDEMFGVFVVDETLTRIERVVNIFPTERWFDYEVRFGRFTADSVEVVGRGATYSDGPMRQWYKWR
jgi:hypothetical protein